MAVDDLGQAEAVEKVLDQEQGANLPSDADHGWVATGEGSGEALELSGCLELVLTAEGEEDPFPGATAGAVGLNELEVGVGPAVRLGGKDALEVQGCPYSSTTWGPFGTGPQHLEFHSLSVQPRTKWRTVPDQISSATGSGRGIPSVSTAENGLNRLGFK
ncbi:MAG: hypothetical protein J2P28_12350, partial [Actinobacteria bacterium]|nr:hypothetical protein [Actinomycetota bacterium]